MTTWQTTGITNNNSIPQGATEKLAQTTQVYADVQCVRYDANWAYLNCSGLASYTMQPFLTNGGGLFGFWPVSQDYTIKIPRTPSTASGIKTPHAGGPFGVMVNGMVIYDLGDAFGFVQAASSPVAGSDAMGNMGTSQGVTVPGTGVTELFNSGGSNLQETISEASVDPSNGNITETVTTLYTGGPKTQETMNSPAFDLAMGNVTLTWTSVEGGTYLLEASNDLAA